MVVLVFLWLLSLILISASWHVPYFCCVGGRPSGGDATNNLNGGLSQRKAVNRLIFVCLRRWECLIVVSKVSRLSKSASDADKILLCCVVDYFFFQVDFRGTKHFNQPKTAPSCVKNTEKTKGIG